MRSRLALGIRSALTVTAVSIALLTLHSGVRPSLAVAQSSPATSQKANIELTTEPSPAQKGTNTVRVKLTDQSGQPISGAEVTVTFLMPAMPSMNMAAMKTVIKGTDKGEGMYEGKGDLGSGGIWHVTITARQNGQIIGTKNLTVKAAGGM
jgi:nitrogen fixation protein FixH